MAEFKVQIKCMWNSETGEFENCAGEEESMQDNEEDEDDDDDDAEWDICKGRSSYTLFLKVIFANADSRGTLMLKPFILTACAALGVCNLFPMSFFQPKTWTSILDLEF